MSEEETTRKIRAVQQEGSRQAQGEYKEFNKIQKIISDFDREIKQLKAKTK